MIFLIDYDRSRGELVSIRPFEDVDRSVAQNERLARELDLHRKGIEREVVLLEANSEAALRRTHGRYFSDLATLAEELIAIASDAASARETRTR